MTYRNRGLHAEIAARRLTARRRATTEHELPTGSSRWLWWACAAAGVALAWLALG